MRRKKYNDLAVFFVLSIIIGLTISNAFANPKLICDYCKRTITNSQYVRVGDKCFHEKHFFCAECSQSLTAQEFFIEENRYYCAKCYNDKFVPKCKKCGEPIIGQYFESDGKKYHKKCYDKFIALRCSLCQKIIEGEYLTDFWGNKYHRYHEKSHPFCLYCRRSISDKSSKGGTVYDDGRNICGICKENTIENIRQAEKLMASILRELNYFGIKIDLKIIKLELVDKNRMSRLSSDRNNDLAGLTLFKGAKTPGNNILRNFNIYLLHGMPRDNFKATMAHELMHVWLYSFSPLEMDPALTEGSCNYASYLLLQNNRGKQVAYILNGMEKDPGIFYGEGYRRVKKMVRRLGIEAWLEHLKKNKNFPSGY